MKGFRRFLLEYTAKTPAHWLFNSTEMHIPVSPRQWNKLTQPVYEDVVHVTDFNGFGRLIKLQKSKAVISTSRMVGSEVICSGVATNGGVICKMHGQLVFESARDLWTVLDTHNLRYFPERMAYTMFQDAGEPELVNKLEADLKRIDKILNQASFDFFHETYGFPVGRFVVRSTKMAYQDVQKAIMYGFVRLREGTDEDGRIKHWYDDIKPDPKAARLHTELILELYFSEMRLLMDKWIPIIRRVGFEPKTKVSLIAETQETLLTNFTIEKVVVTNPLTWERFVQAGYDKQFGANYIVQCGNSGLSTDETRKAVKDINAYFGMA